MCITVYYITKDLFFLNILQCNEVSLLKPFSLIKYNLILIYLITFVHTSK